MPQREIDALLHEVDRSGTGELEMEDFTQLMVLTLSKTAARAGAHARGQEREQNAKQDMQQASLPFEVVALAYRRCAMAPGVGICAELWLASPYVHSHVLATWGLPQHICYGTHFFIDCVSKYPPFCSSTRACGAGRSLLKLCRLGTKLCWQNLQLTSPTLLNLLKF